MARQLTMNLYIKHLRKQYAGADRKTKSKLLDELCQLGNYHRKHAISLLSVHAKAGSKPPKPKKKRGRKKIYDDESLLGPVWNNPHFCRVKIKQPPVSSSLLSQPC